MTAAAPADTCIDAEAMRTGLETAVHDVTGIHRAPPRSGSLARLARLSRSCPGTASRACACRLSTGSAIRSAGRQRAGAGLAGQTRGCCRSLCRWPRRGLRRPRTTAQRTARWLVAAGLLGLACSSRQGFAIGLNGWNAAWLAALFGAPGAAPGRHGLRRGARRCCRLPDAALPRPRGARLVPRRRLRRLVDRPRRRADRASSSSSRSRRSWRAPCRTMPAPSRPAAFVDKFLDPSIWGLDCLTGDLRCGVAWNTLFLAVARRRRHDRCSASPSRSSRRAPASAARARCAC